jgi:hypothetical protein
VPIKFYKTVPMTEAMYWMAASSVAKEGFDDPEVRKQAGQARKQWAALGV